MESVEKSNTKTIKFPIVIRILIVLLVLIIATVAVNVVQNKHFEVSYYAVKNESVSDNIRIVELADLHNSEFGKDNIELVKKIKSLHPDLIFYCGDMMNYGDDNYSVLYKLSDQLAEIAPIYACFGNNELQQYLSRDKKFKIKMAEHKVNWLSNETKEIDVRNTKIQLVAVTEGIDQFDVETNNAKKTVESLNPTSDLRLCLTHYPELFNEKLLNRGIDVAFVGHAHGGLVRIPYVGGVYSTNQGLFPKLTEGVKKFDDGTQLVISRGLGQSNILPRINNKPELVVVDLNWY